MIRVGSIYQINNLYDVYSQLECGEYPPLGFRSGDFVRIYAIHDDCASVVSHRASTGSQMIKIPIEYIIEGEIKFPVDIK